MSTSMKKSLARRTVLVVATCLAAAGALMLGPVMEGRATTEGPIEGLDVETVTIATSDGERHAFRTELAVTAEARRIGLMHREHIGNDEAMLFLFDDVGQRAMWMANTLIPLDMLFIAEDGEILHIHEWAEPGSRDVIPSRYPVLAVLEVAGGTVDRLGIEPGDRTHHRFFEDGSAAD